MKKNAIPILFGLSLIMTLVIGLLPKNDASTVSPDPASEMVQEDKPLAVNPQQQLSPTVVGDKTTVSTNRGYFRVSAVVME